MQETYGFMKDRFLIFTFVAFFFLCASAQEIMERDQIFLKNLNSLYQNPEQTIKVADYLFENATSNSDKAKALYLLSKSKMLQGNTVAGIEDLFRAKEVLREADAPFISSLVLSALSARCRMSGMDDMALNYLKRAENLLPRINSKTEASIAQTVLTLEHFEIASKQKDSEKGIQKLKEIENFSGNDSPAIKAMVENEIGQHYFSISKIDSAAIYFEKSLLLLKQSNLENASVNSVSLKGLGNVSFEENDLVAAKNYFKQALQIPVIEKPVKVEILEKLSELYKKQDSLVLSQKYYNEKAALNTSLIETERKVRSIIFSHIEAEQHDNLLSDKKNYFKWGMLLAALFIFTFAAYFFYNRKLNREYKRFQKVIAQVEKDEKLQAPFSIKEASLKPSKGVVIPEETEKIILERLEEFEKTTKFTNSNINLNLLAKQMKTNSKYISEIIHTHKQKNFNTYINELRINYIIQLMKTDNAYLNYKVSYLAESCGFSSHSAFTVVFKSITGFTPKQFISFLKKSKKEKSPSF